MNLRKELKLRVLLLCTYCRYGADKDDAICVSPKEGKNEVDIENVKCPKCKKKALIKRNY